MPLEAFTPLATPRLTVRRIEEGDLAALMEVNGDEEVTRYLPYPAWKSDEDAHAWFARMARIQEDGSALQLVVVENASGKPVGTCLVFRYDRKHGRAELGYVLGRAYWGRGYMSEVLNALVDAAFGTLDIRRLEAEIDPANVSSRRVLQRLGFKREALLRERFVDKDGFSDSEIYGLLRREWR